MADASSLIPVEPHALHQATECTASIPPFSYLPSMQDIIEHEYALVESIPDEDRAALMPIIRFVRSTLQDPFTTLHDLSQQGSAMDALNGHEEAGMHCKQGIYTEGSHNRFNKGMEEMPHKNAFNGSEGMQCWYANRMIDVCTTSMPWQRATTGLALEEDLHQHLNSRVAHNQQEAQNLTSLGFGSENPRLLSDSRNTSHGNYGAQSQEQRSFALGSPTYKGLHDPNALTLTNSGTPESELKSILSGVDMESFHLEELRRSLRPPSCDDDMDSDGNDVKSVDVHYSNDGDADVDKDGCNCESFSAYHHDDKALSASDVAWGSYWGDALQYYPVTSTDNRLQFPKAHCRRRNVIKKAVGWVTKRATQSFALSRVRHKRKCNLPCCTGYDTGIKRRKTSGQKCAKLSILNKRRAYGESRS